MQKEICSKYKRFRPLSWSARSRAIPERVGSKALKTLFYQILAAMNANLFVSPPLNVVIILS